MQQVKLKSIKTFQVNQSISNPLKFCNVGSLLEGSVKLTSMQLVGEFIAAISVPLDAIMKLENVDYCGKRLSESAVELV